MTRLLLAAAALVVVLAAAGVGAGATWDVYPGAGTPIQDAIDGAGEGDTIYVHAGTYVENVAVWKRVTLIGDGADVVTVRARDGQDHVFEVIADHVNISGFTLTGAGYAVYASGIYLGSNVDHCNISGNRALNNGCGIYLSYSSNNMLTGNTANSNFNGGIHLSYSSNNMLTGNTANSKYNGGIYLSYSSNNMLTGNNFVDDGLFVEYSYHNSVENNTVNGKPLIYLEDAADYTITNAGQVILVNCNNITVEDLNLSNTIVGIELWGTDNSIITNITANSNFNCGILLYSSSNNMLTGNTANSNNNRGIYLYYSSNNMLTGNTASNNRYGICLFGSSNNNALTDNIFVNDGFFVWSSYHNSAENNTVNGKPLVYLEDVADYTITNAGQVILVNCNNITAEDLNLSNTTIGIELWGTDNSTITNITASNNYYGIYLRSSSGNLLTTNTANSNIWYGVFLWHSSNNTLYHNNLINNTWHNAFDDPGTNAWNSGSEGNYWSDYREKYPYAEEVGESGVWNTPYPIPGGGGVDNYPLMQPWEEPTELRVHNLGTGKNFSTIQAAIDDPDTHDGHTIMVDAGTYIENVDVNKRLTLIGEGADVVTVRAGDAGDHVFEVTADWVNISGFTATGTTHCSGIYLNNTNHCCISDNNALNNNHGIWLYSSSNNVLMDNAANSNNGCGIGMCYSRNNTLIDNIVNLNNDDGIYLDYNSNNNTLYHNNFLNNTQNAHDYGAHDSYTNAWDSGVEGNYWSDYTGTDNNTDGIGDDPYDIPGGSSVDRYPLTGIRWLPPEITRSRLGINTHWYKWAEDFPAYKEKIKNFGIIRDGAWWYDLETSDLTGSEWDHANWDYPYNMETFCGRKMTYQSGYDNLVKLYQDEDSPELLMVLNQDNNNISSSDAITADQYSDYVYHIVERYDGDGVNDMPGLIRPVRYFEVGNEVDYGNMTANPNHDHIPPKDYVEKRLIPAYNAAKSANKDAVVLCAGLGMGSDLYGNDGQEFNTMYFDAMYDNITKNGGNNNNNFYMDKVAIHYYAKPNAEFDENIKKVEDVIQKYENRDKPIWITEFFPLNETCQYDSTTGAFARLLTLMFANKIEMPIIYSLKGEHDVTCVGDEETITPRESIQVIDTVVSTLHGTTPSETENENLSVEPGKTTYQRVFNNSGKKVTVLWYIDDADSGAVTNYDYTASPESSQTFTVDALGTANFSTDPSPIHLKIGSNPTYVVETDPPIDLDLYFNKTTTAGVATERATSFRVGDTLYGRLKTTTITSHAVKTYITMTLPDGTCRYAHYDKPDFVPGIDKLLFSDTKIQLYNGVWNATTNDWLWNIYEFTGGDSGTYRWNCWYEDAETGEILGGDSTEYTFLETPSGTPVDSSTGRGEVYLDSSAGTIEDLAAISPDDMPEVPESLNPVYGFFSFEITGVSSGESVNIPLAFPENVPAGTEYWKYGPTPEDSTPHWYQIPVSDDDGDRIIVITLTDGGIGDDDRVANGVIVDGGGPSLPLSKKGDLNGDGILTPADAAIALRIAAIGGWDADADVSGDGRVTSLDSLMILQAAADAIDL